jgi:cell division protein FtsB
MNLADPKVLHDLIIGLVSTNLTAILGFTWHIIKQVSSVPAIKRDLDLAWNEIRQLTAHKIKLQTEIDNLKEKKNG